MNAIDTTPIHVQIHEILINKGTKFTWVASKLKISNTYLTFILKGNRKITPAILQGFNEILGTDFKISN